MTDNMNKLPGNIFREYDIRGLADTELTDEVVENIGMAFGTYLSQRGVRKASIGGDVRLSTDRIKNAVIRGLTSIGIDIVDIGIVTTPILYWSMFHLNLDGAVMVTGSHNPKDMNGLKLAYGKATLYGKEIQDIRAIIENNRMVKTDRKGTVTRTDISQGYVDMLLSKIKLGKRKLKVVLDSGNGTAGLFASSYFNGLGCETIPLFCEPDGHFPNHHPDPLKRENLRFVIDAIKRYGADLGIAFDGDADRIGVVDDKGNVVWGDILMAFYWREILPKHPGAIAIIEVKCSQALEDEILRLGGKPYYWKAGHSLIKAKMKELHALFSGELSGHMFFADEYFGYDDSFYAAGRLLRILSSSDKTLSELLSDMPVYYSTAEVRVDCPDDRKFDVIEAIKEEALKDHEAITVDGVRIKYPDGWGLVRASNTQPELVTRCEGRTENALRSITDDMKHRMIKAGLPDFEWTY